MSARILSPDDDCTTRSEYKTGFWAGFWSAAALYLVASLVVVGVILVWGVRP